MNKLNILKKTAATLLLCLALIPMTTQYQHKQVDVSAYTCMLAVLYSEARGEPLEGIHAVASVVLNRVKHKNYPDTVCGVVVQNKQFTGVYNTLRMALNTPRSLQKDLGYTVVATIAFKSLYGRFKPSVDALHYHVVGHKVYWGKYLKNRRVIGMHVFGSVYSPTSKR